jgi:hypothetical protein
VFIGRGAGLDPVPLGLHPQQGQKAGVHEVDVPNVGLAGIRLSAGKEKARPSLT